MTVIETLIQKQIPFAVIISPVNFLDGEKSSTKEHYAIIHSDDRIKKLGFFANDNYKDIFGKVLQCTDLRYFESIKNDLQLVKKHKYGEVWESLDFRMYVKRKENMFTSTLISHRNVV